VLRLRPEIGYKRTGCRITTTRRLTLRIPTTEFLTKDNLTVVSHQLYFPLFPRLKIKPKGRHFDTSEVIAAESQAVLNTEHDFLDAI
jgi:hypothetical protein